MIDLSSDAHEALRAWAHRDGGRALTFHRAGGVTLSVWHRGTRLDATFASAVVAADALGDLLAIDWQAELLPIRATVDGLRVKLAAHDRLISKRM